MREFFIAATICWFSADIATTALPIGSVVAQSEPIRIVTVLVCAPKDHDRVTPGMLIPRLVATERIVAATMPPAVQAAEQRSKRKR